MSVSDTHFTTPQLEDFAIGAGVRAQPWQDVLRNQNYLFRQATGEALPGGSSTTLGHDHENNGGPSLNRSLCFPWGYAASPVYGSERPWLELSSGFSSLETSERLTRWPLSGPQLSRQAASGAFTLFLSGDWAETVMSYGYLVASPSPLRERLLIKKARYESDIAQTRVTLWDPISDALSAGTAMHLYRTNGASSLPLYIPFWANSVQLYFRAACTVSLEQASNGAPTFYDYGTPSDYSWLFELQLTSGDTASASQRFYPGKTITPNWRVLNLSLDSFEKNQIHFFRLSLALNPKFSTLSPIVYHPRDLSFWLNSPHDAPSPFIVVLSSTKGA